jgi:hypothetical protein
VERRSSESVCVTEKKKKKKFCLNVDSLTHPPTMSVRQQAQDALKSRLASINDLPQFRWGTTSTGVTALLVSLLILSFVYPEATQRVLLGLFSFIGALAVVLYAVFAVPPARYSLLKALLKWRGWAYNPASPLSRFYLGVVGVLGGSKPTLWELEPTLPNLPVPDLAHTCRLYLASVRAAPHRRRVRPDQARRRRVPGGGRRRRAAAGAPAAARPLRAQLAHSVVGGVRLSPLSHAHRHFLQLVRPRPRRGHRPDARRPRRQRRQPRAPLPPDDRLAPPRAQPRPGHHSALDVHLLAHVRHRPRAGRRAGPARRPQLAPHRRRVSREQFFKVAVYDKKGKLLSVSDIQTQLQRCVDESAQRDPAAQPNVAALTSQNRDTWAKQRDDLIAMDETNAHALQAIETALFVLVFDDLARPPSRRWRASPRTATARRSGSTRTST